MWFSKCAKQRILALAARFSYTCGELCIAAPAALLYMPVPCGMQSQLYD